MGTFAGLPTRLTPFCPASRCPSPNNKTKPPVRWQARTRGLGDIQMLINYDSYDAVRQALAHAEKFITQATGRSEEHTSELQSLMRISSAVFCLKKKNIHIDLTHTKEKY